ncbi:MAG: hypothetical protein MMC33_007625 [Icmadophila ericetorum]|nr:hypothetical protein [Icmadophila ericetorum]
MAEQASGNGILANITSSFGKFTIGSHKCGQFVQIVMEALDLPVLAHVQKLISISHVVTAALAVDHGTSRSDPRYADQKKWQPAKRSNDGNTSTTTIVSGNTYGLSYDRPTLTLNRTMITLPVLNMTAAKIYS